MVWSNFLALPEEKEEDIDVEEDFIDGNENYDDNENHDDNEDYDDTMINMIIEATCHAFHPCIHTGHCQHRKWAPGWSYIIIIILIIYHHHHHRHNHHHHHHNHIQ